MSEKPDLKLMLDSSLRLFHEGKLIAGELMPQLPMTIAKDTSVASVIKNMFGDRMLNLQDNDWEYLAEMYEFDESEDGGISAGISAGISGGKKSRKMKARKYQDKAYANMVYFPKKSSSAPVSKLSKNDIMRWELAGGDPRLFDAITEIPDSVVAGSVKLQDEAISSIESFFEQYSSSNAQSRAQSEDIKRWKDVSSYEEFLQAPLLKEGRDFMNKFLDIEERIAAGATIPAEELETLIPDYMRGGHLTLMQAVDPAFTRQSYILSQDVSELTKELINRAFMNTFAAIRGSTLADVKSILFRLEQVTKFITKKSNTLMDNSQPAVMAGKKTRPFQ